MPASEEITWPRTYTCEGCGATFHGTPEEAFNQGWDTPERFMSHCTCPNCTIDKTLWWRIVIEKRTEPLTGEEAEMMLLYNRLFETYNGVSLREEES